MTLEGTSPLDRPARIPDGGYRRALARTTSQHPPVLRTRQCSARGSSPLLSSGRFMMVRRSLKNCGGANPLVKKPCPKQPLHQLVRKEELRAAHRLACESNRLDGQIVHEKSSSSSSALQALLVQ